MHKQVFVSVKAPVDSKLKDLIEILNRIPNVWTCESCENTNGESFVSLRYGHLVSSGQGGLCFAYRLSQAMRESKIQSTVNVELNSSSWTSPRIYFRFLVKNIDEIRRVISSELLKNK